jgi:hypothetical protein
VLVATVRNVTTPNLQTGASWLLDHPELATLLWCVMLLAVSMPFAVERFNHTNAA